jgi:5-carboxymethyl-2-hydroxymuconate isomerase
MMNKLQYPVVKTSRTIHAVPQFRPIKKGARRKGIERVYNYKNGVKLTIQLFKECDIADQSLLYAVISMCLSIKRGKLLGNDTKSDVGKKLREALKIKGQKYLNMDSIIIKTNKYELNKELGKKNTKANREWILDSLRRLVGISFRFEDKFLDFEAGFHLISYCYEEGEIEISINPLSAAVILNNGGFVHIHREERLALKSDVARGLHSVLAGMVDPGKKRNLNVDMLADKVYARYDEDIARNTIEQRRNYIKSAGAEINQIDGWEVNILGRGGKMILEVFRKKKR